MRNDDAPSHDKPRHLPEHGTRSRYSNHGCRCEPCRSVHRQYDGDRSRRKAYGTWQPYVDATPVRAHVRSLMSRGIGWRHTADIAGVPKATVNQLLYGLPGRGRKPPTRVRQHTADRLLAVQFDTALLADGALVDATGTWRRVRALVAVGWPKVHIARALGSRGQGLQLQDTKVQAATARKVSDLYDAWWNADPAAHGVDGRQAVRARAYARERGWPPPMAWDDDALDDPAAEPHGPASSDCSRRMCTAEERLQDIAHLAAAGATVEEVAARLSISTHYVNQLLNRHPAPPRQAEAD